MSKEGLPENGEGRELRLGEFDVIKKVGNDFGDLWESFEGMSSEEREEVFGWRVERLEGMLEGLEGVNEAYTEADAAYQSNSTSMSKDLRRLEAKNKFASAVMEIYHFRRELESLGEKYGLVLPGELVEKLDEIITEDGEYIQ